MKLTSSLHPPSPTGVNSKSARVLLLLVVPGQLVFLYTISLLQGQEAPVSVAFTVCYLCAAMLQVDCKHTDTHEGESQQFSGVSQGEPVKFHASIHLPLLCLELGWQSQERCPDFLGSSYLLKLIWLDSKLLPSQARNSLTPSCPGSTLDHHPIPPRWDILEQLSMEASRRHPRPLLLWRGSGSTPISSRGTELLTLTLQRTLIWPLVSARDQSHGPTAK